MIGSLSAVFVKFANENFPSVGIFAPTHCFDNKNEIQSISQMDGIVGTSRYVMFVWNVLLSNDVINMFSIY